jgi:hypothetical protein
LAFGVESKDQHRTVGERLRSPCVLQDQVFVTAQQRDTVDSPRNIGHPIVIDGSLAYPARFRNYGSAIAVSD